jgi:RimJ/RimL family protein N-acetyltransferase
VKAASSFTLEWSTPVGVLRVIEPTDEEVAHYAPALAAFYNDPHNSAMMANTQALSTEDVADHFAAIRREGGRALLLFVDGELMGDADLRHVEPDCAEFAFMIGARTAQGRGLGTRLGLMVNAFALHTLGIDRIYASVLPHNHASLRAFEKMGFTFDDRPAARRYAENESDVTLSIGRAEFDLRNPDVVAELKIEAR